LASDSQLRHLMNQKKVFDGDVVFVGESFERALKRFSTKVSTYRTFSILRARRSFPSRSARLREKRRKSFERYLKARAKGVIK
jgi:ribosomal protein S21